MKLTPLIAGLAQAGALVLAGVLAVAMQVAACAPSGAQPSGPPEGTNIGFSLTTADGNAVSERTYRGKWLLVYFGYTFCPSSCPTTLLAVSMALKKLGPDAAQVRPLFISVDPERDTPKVMQQYIESFDPRIVGLTGTPQQIAAAAHEYGAYYVRHSIGPGPNDYVVDHSTYLYVMDPRGRFVRAFDPDASGDQIADVLHTLVARWRDEGVNGHKPIGHSADQGAG